MVSRNLVLVQQKSVPRPIYAGGRLASLSVRFPDPRSLCPLASLDSAPVTARPVRASGAESSSRSLRACRYRGSTATQVVRSTNTRTKSPLRRLLRSDKSRWKID